MIRVSLELGRYIPGSEPQFMEPGLALHVCVCLVFSLYILL